MLSYIYNVVAMSFKALCDFESLGEVKVSSENASFSLLTINDDIALESNDIVKLMFEPLYQQFIDVLEKEEEFVRMTAFVHIVDNDGEYCRPTCQNSGLDICYVMQLWISILMNLATLYRREVN